MPRSTGSVVVVIVAKRRRKNVRRHSRSASRYVCGTRVDASADSIDNSLSQEAPRKRRYKRTWSQTLQPEVTSSLLGW